ncbi:VOC family protein [Cerasicoccus arenae]|nr:VOC family protein [Cerasicoccus arenae]
MKKETVKKLDCMSPQFLVSDLDQAIRFYTEELGFSLNFKYQDFYAGINCNGHSIHLKTGSVPESVRAFMRANEHLNITFGVLDIEEVYNEICRKNIDVIQPLRKMPYGKEFYISDPDGNIIGFFWSE